MNAYAIVILATLLLSHGLELVSRILDVRALRPDLPEEFRGVWDPERYRRSQEYSRATTRFGLVEETFWLVVLLVFWFAGGFEALDDLARRTASDLGLGAIGTGLVFIGALVLGRMVLDLPFAVYSTFVIEERFGFNRTTPGTFVADRLKGLAVAAVLGAPLLAGILYFFEAAGDRAWLYCWLLVVAFSLVMQLVFPRWILPLFNKFRPLAEGELRERIISYARSVRFPIEQVFVIDGSRRSSKSNAFFTGLGRSKRLALFDTLVEKQSPDELVAVVAHEVGHYKKKHILQGTLISIAHSGVVLFLLGIFLHHEGLFEAFLVDEPSVHAGLVFFGLLFTPIELILSIALQAVSRRNEFQADRFAATTIDEPEDLVSALKKLSADNLVNLTPHPFHVFLHYSHPPMLERIRAIRSAVAARA